MSRCAILFRLFWRSGLGRRTRAVEASMLRGLVPGARLKALLYVTRGLGMTTMVLGDA